MARRFVCRQRKSGRLHHGVHRLQLFYQLHKCGFVWELQLARACVLQCLLEIAAPGKRVRDSCGSGRALAPWPAQRGTSGWHFQAGRAATTRHLGRSRQEGSHGRGCMPLAAADPPRCLHQTRDAVPPVRPNPTAGCWSMWRPTAVGMRSCVRCLLAARFRHSITPLRQEQRRWWASSMRCGCSAPGGKCPLQEPACRQKCETNKWSWTRGRCRRWSSSSRSVSDRRRRSRSIHSLRGVIDEDALPARQRIENQARDLRPHEPVGRHFAAGE